MSAFAVEWQWSAPMGNGRAFLWIPPDYHQVRAVVVGQNNMIEPGIMECDFFRRELARLGIAEIFIAPPFDTFQSATNNDQATAQFDGLLKTLAEASGYGELVFAPVIPLGHSAMASYPWNFAAWNPARTLAILSVHGDAPQTKLTGNGRPNLDWGSRNIDGIPALMVMGEYEWMQERLTPAQQFRAAHPAAPLAVLADAGHGHFDYSDEMIHFLALFIRKAAEQRLPTNAPLDRPVELKPVDAHAGWLVDCWRTNQPPQSPAAPFAEYRGDTNKAFWCFDRELARATENFNPQRGKRPQLLGFIQDGQIVPQTDSHQQVSLKFEPLADGVTFHLAATFLSSVAGGSKNLPRWTGLPVGSPLGHAGSVAVRISRISGPVEQISGETFRIQFDRIYSTSDRRNNDIWLLASHPGNAKYKSAVQQALMKLPAFAEGAEQQIDFPAIADQKVGVKSLRLQASSDSGRSVHFFVREGPVEVEGDGLRFTRIPPRAKFPVKVAVTAWQLGCSTEPKFKTAAPVTREFFLTN